MAGRGLFDYDCRSMHLIVSWLTLSLGLYVTAMLVPGFEVRNGFRGALLVGALFGALHFAIGWFLFVLIGIGTLFIGFVFAFLTRWIVTAIVLKLVDSLSETLVINRFRTALVGSAVLGIFSAVSEIILSGHHTHGWIW